MTDFVTSCVRPSSVVDVDVVPPIDDCHPSFDPFPEFKGVQFTVLFHQSLLLIQGNIRVFKEALIGCYRRVIDLLNL